MFRPPAVYNEPIKSYAPGSPERATLQNTLRDMASERADMPCVIGGQDVRTGRLGQAVMPHRHAHVLGDFHLAGEAEVMQGIAAALDARREWAAMPWHERAAIFLRAADLLAGDWRPVLNGATMLGQSKTAHQAEIDAAAELCDFLRFNVDYLQRIYQEQPI